MHLVRWPTLIKVIGLPPTGGGTPGPARHRLDHQAAPQRQIPDVTGQHLYEPPQHVADVRRIELRHDALAGTSREWLTCRNARQAGSFEPVGDDSLLKPPTPRARHCGRASRAGHWAARCRRAAATRLPDRTCEWPKPVGTSPSAHSPDACGGAEHQPGGRPQLPSTDGWHTGALEALPARLIGVGLPLGRPSRLRQTAARPRIVGRSPLACCVHNRPASPSSLASPAPSGAHSHRWSTVSLGHGPPWCAGRAPASTAWVGDRRRIATAATLSG
jgi:hypothetical protein